MAAVERHEVDNGTRLLDCSFCHDPHFTYQTTDAHTGQTAENLALIRSDMTENIPGAVIPAVFQQQPDNYSFQTAPYNGICQTCHTGTSHHSNAGVDPDHLAGSTCTTCHKHDKGFTPGGCTTCHAESQNTRRVIVGSGGDFELASHHVRGSATDDDCLACHYIRDHGSQIVKLKDPDQGEAIIYAYDPNAPEQLEAFCLGCHDSDGAAALSGGDHPFSDGRIPPDVKGSAGNLWSNSAHKLKSYAQNDNTPITCIGDGATTGCHGNAHGSTNEKLLSATQGTQTIAQFCYNCHTEGKVMNDAIANNRVGGYVAANDIQEAFGKSRKHALGATFSNSGNTYTLQCTTCHNPHVVTGQYWEAETGKTPVTRPNFGADPATNPRAMGTMLWGDEPGEKMDDFAARGSGSGGFYYQMARGKNLGDAPIIDQPAKYQPPKNGSGYQFEYSGKDLPDYTTFCLDCHSSRVSAAIPEINWGQGIGCTDNSVDPPDQRVECGAAHGLSNAGTSSYISDEGTAGFWGTSGNPDMIFDMNYVTRGRHNGHFMRWPYDSADRGSGANFVLACTDCHEAHGSNRGGMIRERFSVNANGDCGTGGNTDPDGENCSDGGNWNSFCNACHYYYGGQHAGMSCGTASCHEANSIHRIIHSGGGGSKQLMVTHADYIDSFQRPDFTPEIESVSGHIGSNQLNVTFRPSVGSVGIFTESDLSGALTPEDFWTFDTDLNNPKTITGVTHTAGDYMATLSLSAPLEAVDLDRDTLATRGASIWDWYSGGYNNYATGVIAPEAVSAGPWPMTITGPPPLGIDQVAFAGAQIRVRFTEGVYGSGIGGAIQAIDLALTNCGARSILSVDHTPGAASATLTLSSPLEQSDIGVCTVASAPYTIVDNYNNYLPPDLVALSTPDDCPTTGATYQFNEPAASSYVFDEAYQYAGVVNNPVVSLVGDGTYSGDENVTTPDPWTTIRFEGNPTCFNDANALTVEARIYPTAVDLDWVDVDPVNGIDDDIDDDGVDTRNTTFNRIFERKRALKITLMHTWYSGDEIPSRDDKARIQVKYFVDAESRHTCPNPQWPEDTYVGNDARWHQINTDIDQWPILNNHWYRIRVVFNSNKSGIPGSNGTPVDIFVDDQGTDGNETGELWTGYINASDTINGSSTCQWGALPGDFIALEDQPAYIGSAIPDATTGDIDPLMSFKGEIDWLTWKPGADYSGVDEAPR